MRRTESVAGRLTSVASLAVGIPRFVRILGHQARAHAGFLVAALLVGAAVTTWIAARPQRHSARPFIRPPFDDVAFKLWNRFLVRDDGRVILAVNEDGHFRLYEYSPGARRQLLPDTVDAIDAFLVGDRVVGLVDARGDDHLVPADPAVASLVPGGSVESVFGSPDHRGAVVLTATGRELHWIDFTTGAVQLISKVSRRMEGVAFCSPSEIVVAHDGGLALYDTSAKTTRPLARELAGRKRNPSCANGEILLSAEDGGELYGIYRIADIHGDGPPERLLREGHDLLEPKRRGDFVYFVAVIDSEYLLRRLSLRTGRSEDLTRNGVVYEYELIGTDTLVYSHRDMQTPAAVISMSLIDRSTSIIERERADVLFGIESVPAQDGRSGAFVFQPPASTPPAGSILYFGPRGADVSPRWDRHLMGLLYQGYTIYAPNYPGSVGFGRSYEDAPLSRAVDDMTRWGTFVKSRSHPVCYLSVSSGNVVMESVLGSDSANVVAAAAMFGLSSSPAYRPPVPTLFALGEEDPIVPFGRRTADLRLLGDPNVRVVGYANEGHWLHRREDLDDLLRRIHEACQGGG
jgi:hypothetical protein